MIGEITREYEVYRDTPASEVSSELLFKLISPGGLTFKPLRAVQHILAVKPKG